MYYKIDTGIYQHGNVVRAYASINGKDVTEYFNTEGEAREWRQGAKKKNSTSRADSRRPSRPRIRSKKRVSKNPELPVGLYESVTRKQMKNGTTHEYLVINARITTHGVTLKTIARTYGINRTREKAIKEVLLEREKWEKFFFE